MVAPDHTQWHAVGLYWVPGHAGIRGNEIADEFARGGSGLGFLGPEPALGVSRRDIQNKINCWLANQQWARWPSPDDTQRQARELISGPSLGAKTKVMSFNPLNPELNPICYLLALLSHHFVHVSRIRFKSLTLRLLMSYIYIYIWSTYSWCF